MIATTAPGCDARLYLLGGFELEIDGMGHELQPALRRLLALIALAPRGVDRTFAAFQLWPDSCEERVRANLRSALWRLRKLPVVLLTTSKSHLRLAPDVWVDARDGVAELAATGADASVDTALPFDALMSGLLPDWYDDWLVIERERLRQLSLRTLEERAEVLLDAGRTSEAIQVALAAVAIDPLRDSAHRLVIGAHLREGNAWEARRQLAQYRDRLAIDPGLSPSPEIEQLLAQVDEQRAAATV